MTGSQTAALPSFSVAGKHVLITGGAGGIGAAFARCFRAADASVTVTDVREPPPDLAARGIAFERLDVRDDGAVRALAARTPRLDVLIHCAGNLAGRQEYEVDVFRDVLDVHLAGNLRLAQAFRPLLSASRGCLINIASIYSFFGQPRIPAYAAAKAAVVSLTKSLALQWAREGVRVNAIAPGWIETELSRGARDDADFIRQVMDRLPMGRWAQPEELCGAALFLASDAASYMTGTTVAVDGGYAAG